MYSSLANEIKAIFLRTLLIFEGESFLFEISKEKIKRTLRDVLIDIEKAEPKEIRKLKEK